MLNSEKLLEKLYKIKSSKTPIDDLDTLINEVKADILTENISVGKGFARKRITILKSMLEKGIKKSIHPVLYYTKQYDWNGKDYQIVMLDGAYGLLALEGVDKITCLPSYEENKEEKKLCDFPKLDTILMQKTAYNVNMKQTTGKYLYELIRQARINKKSIIELEINDDRRLVKCYYDRTLLDKILIGLNVKEDTQLILKHRLDYAENSPMVIEVEDSNSFAIILPCKKLED